MITLGPTTEATLVFVAITPKTIKTYLGLPSFNRIAHVIHNPH